ncbi:hypothetical protein [Chamaesiphon polymorphus]|nr:hypothetical protein [Chamaesiphon polymorphus]
MDNRLWQYNYPIGVASPTGQNDVSYDPRLLQKGGDRCADGVLTRSI